MDRHRRACAGRRAGALRSKRGVMTMNTRSPVSHRKAPARLALWAAALLVGMMSAASAQQSFKSADEAMNALAGAAKSGDQQAVLAILGKDAEDLVSSGDPVDDQATRQRFLTAFDEKHAIEKDGDTKAIMIVGKDDFPFPIPIVRKGDTWSFDAAAGREEILDRRIGRNELDAIQAVLAYVDAQNDYADKDRGAGTGVYAQRIVSQPGKKDGLYWPSAQGEEESPLGELVADASAKGYKVGGGRAPYLVVVAVIGGAATTTRFSPSRARMHPAASSITWCTAR